MASKFKLAGLLGAAAIGVSTVAGSAAAGINVLPNGDFSNSLTGWHGTPNAKLEVATGSGLLVNTFDELSEDSVASAYQCIAVSDSKNYHFFGAVFIPSGQQRSGYARLVTSFYPTNNCNGVPLDVHKSAPFHETGAWLTDSSDLVRTDPKTAYSLKVELIVKKDSTEQAAKQFKSFAAKFDNIKVMQTSKPAAEPELPTAVGEEPATPPVKQPTIVPPAPNDTGSPTPTPPSAVTGEDNGSDSDQLPDGSGDAPTEGDTSGGDTPEGSGNSGDTSGSYEDAPTPGETEAAVDDAEVPATEDVHQDGEASDGTGDTTPGDAGGSDAGEESDSAVPTTPEVPNTGNSSGGAVSHPFEAEDLTVQAADDGGAQRAMAGFAAVAGAGLLGMMFFAMRRRRRQG